RAVAGYRWHNFFLNTVAINPSAEDELALGSSRKENEKAHEGWPPWYAQAQVGDSTFAVLRR
uniref:hypothetical protein n=1 Tax=Klebsiella pneumoniae TaxID=573 RepID=UPI003AABE6DD